MARVTVEDCIDKVRQPVRPGSAGRTSCPDDLVRLQLTVDRDNDKNPVVSLREIADSSISPGDLREELVHSLQKFVEVDEPEPTRCP